ncbi:MAG: serine/threonine protein kinase, partial [Planctomycetaceae bacterium]|nr:serine/threonine protein kinase [Planctomycetaceae bacterium]
TGTIIGTPAYMAPEQAAGRIREISPQSDVYSLGAILYELLTGRPPFQRSNPLDTLMEVIESEPPLPRSLNSSIPEELELICLRCLEKDPDCRYRSAAELGADLERWLRGESITATSRGWFTRVRRWARREPALVAHWAGLLAAAGIIETSYRLNGGDSAYHADVMWQLGLWAVISLVFQRMLSSGQAAGLARFSWAGADALLLTSILCSVTGDIGPLLIGYPLLVVASGMFFQVRLVVFMTVACLLSYGVLSYLCPQAGQPAHYPFIFGSVLAIVGGLVAWQVFRIRTLCHYFEHRRPG